MPFFPYASNASHPEGKGRVDGNDLVDHDFDPGMETAHRKPISQLLKLGKLELR